MIDIALDHNLQQLVTEPTRGKNTLELFFTNNESLVQQVNVKPGLSDHVYVEIECLAKTKRTPPIARRRVFLCKKANFDVISEDMETLDQLLAGRESPNDVSSNDVESMWETFKTTLSNSMEKNIPSKLVSKKKNSRPLINTVTRRALRKKQKLYRKAKRSGNDEGWAQFRKLRRTLERRIRKQHRDYVSGTIGASLETNNSKPFWNYLKALNLTSFGITSLTKKTGKVVFTPEEKASILNEQFQSVFTDENADRMPDLRTTTTATLPPLVVSNAGVHSLLSRLDSNKAPGPDGIQARVLRQCANSISPALCRLFQASIDTGYLPHDWRSANITPI